MTSESTEITRLRSSNDDVADLGWMSFRLLGPGLFVCLADTDAGCLIVAAQSGSRWGYSLLLLQIVLIPVLFATQELTIRLAVYTQQGQTACIKQYFGKFWAWFACFLLIIECFFAMTSEMSGIAVVAELYGFGRTSSTFMATVLIVSVVVGCSYRTVEMIGVMLGLCELVFVMTMFMLHPPFQEVLHGTFTFYNDPEYIQLVATNIGAVIMPWMVYFQQNAVVARRLATSNDLKEERAQTLFGSILTQLVMIGMLITLAASKARPSDLESVADIVTALEPLFGYNAARALVTIGFVGGSLCAAFVVSLAASWAICEAVGVDVSLSLDVTPARAPVFYGSFTAITLFAAIVLLLGIDIVELNLFVELLDGLLVPVTVGFLYLLSISDLLPPEARLQGVYKYLLGAVFSICSAVSLGCAFYAAVAPEDATEHGLVERITATQSLRARR